MNVFETSHVRKTYGKKVVLDDVNLTVREGEIYGLVGRNGAGKTTLMRVLLGLAKADGGDIRINGVSSKDALCYERSKIGAIIDTPSLLLHLNALDNMKAVGFAIGERDEQKLAELIKSRTRSAKSHKSQKLFARYEAKACHCGCSYRQSERSRA